MQQRKRKCALLRCVLDKLRVLRLGTRADAAAAEGLTDRGRDGADCADCADCAQGAQGPAPVPPPNALTWSNAARRTSGRAADSPMFVLTSEAAADPDAPWIAYCPTRNSTQRNVGRFDATVSAAPPASPASRRPRLSGQSGLSGPSRLSGQSGLSGSHVSLSPLPEYFEYTPDTSYTALGQL